MAEVDTIDIPDVTPVTRTVATVSKLIKTAGLPGDAASTATDTTSVSQTSIQKQISASAQVVAGAVSSSKMATKAASGDFADGAVATIGAKADAANAATDTTSVSAISIWKQISLSIQAAAASLLTIITNTAAPTPAGTNVMGKVTTDQTTHGTTDLVAADLTKIAGNAAAAGNGVSGTGVQRVAIASDNTPFPNYLVPNTSGGLSRSRTLIPNNTTAIVVKASAGQLYKVRATNNSATIAYIKIYDATSATAGSGTPVDTIMIPAATAGGAGVVDTTDIGAAHATGITFVVTTGIADADTTAPAASAYIVTVFYK